MYELRKLTDLLRVLQDPTRLRLLWVLRRGELSVGEVVQVTGLSQPRVSRHLKLLCDARAVRRTPDQNEVYYRAAIDDDHRDLVEAVLSSVSESDPVISRDRQRLIAILDSRLARARTLLDRLGVCSLGATDMSEVGAVIDALLARWIPTAPNGGSLGDLLDIGTGTGSMLRLLAGRARRAVAVDLSRDMRLIARAAALSSGLANCTVCQGDMYDLEFTDRCFDLVTMDRVLGTADDPAAALREAARVMNDEALLLIIEAGTAPAANNHLERHLVQAGLKAVELRSAARESVLVTLAAKAASSCLVPGMIDAEIPGDS